MKTVVVVAAVAAAIALLPGAAGAATDRTPPTRPTGLRVTSTAPTQVGLAWTKSTDNVGVAGYYVYRGTTRLSAGTNAYTDTGLKASTSYTYSVAAFDRAGNLSTRSTSVTVNTPAAPPPGLPALPALPPPPAPPTTTGGTALSACTAITSPGTYALASDITAPADTTCLDVHDTSAVRSTAVATRLRRPRRRHPPRS
jgi:hypothetical protein